MDELAELSIMARRAWLERGLIILRLDQIRDEWDRQHVRRLAEGLYGKRTSSAPVSS